MAKRQLLDRASQIIGEQAIDVIFVQNRPKSALAVFAIVAIPAALGLNLLWMALAGGVAGLGYTALTDYRFIASTPTRLVLLSAVKWSLTARPHEVEGDLQPSDIQLTDKAGINRVVLVKGQQYILSRIFVSRLETMLARSG